MTEPDFDNVFADLMDGDEELQAFLQSVQEQLPRVVAQLRTDDGSVVPADAAWPWPADLCRRLCEEAGAANGLVAARTADGEWLYGIPITELEGVLLLVFPGRAGNIVDEPHDLDLLQGVIAFARLQQQHQLLLIENQQIFRQINVLNQQHSALVEDNFRQYRLIQEKEKDYARKLESEIARQTAELRKTNARLEEASRLQSEFLANMSHELRTPMNAIIGFTELLTETELKDDQAEYVNTIKQAGSNLLVLINDILDLAKIEAGKIDLEKEPFEVRQLVDSVAGLFRLPAMEKKVAFSVDMGAEVPLLVVGDANRLRQVLINLAGNAMKFTDHGEVAIVVRGGRQQGERLELHFAVRDSGIGIAPERQQAIFDKFTQADGSTTRKYGGTGLGLAISSQLVRLMGGEIGIESVEGKGSTFSFKVPLSTRKKTPDAAPVVPAEARQSQPAGATLPLRVLLVEDNPVNQRLASIIIKKQGYGLGVANDGVEALAQLKERVFDVVLMDVQMPNMDGLEATRRIREIEAAEDERQQYAGLRDRSRPLPVIGLTAHARKEDEQICYGVGMTGFLTKPIIRERLVAVLGEEAGKGVDPAP